MKYRAYRLFTIIELALVMVVMGILAYAIFVAIKGVKDSSRKVITESTLATCKSSIEMVYNYIFNESRMHHIEVYQHPLFTKVWPSNKVWTFIDKEESDRGMKANGLKMLMSVGGLDLESKDSFATELEYSGSDKYNTLVDGWGNPILLMRNEIVWHSQNLKPGDDVIGKVYQDRKKTNLGLYAKYIEDSSAPGRNLFEWNDTGFDHINNGVTESAYEVAPMQTNGYKKVQIAGKIAVPYNTNDFDFFSPGKDGKIGNLIKGDKSQDRWSRWEVSAKIIVKWVSAVATTNIDFDDDNLTTFHRYYLE